MTHLPLIQFVFLLEALVPAAAADARWKIIPNAAPAALSAGAVLLAEAQLCALAWPAAEPARQAAAACSSARDILLPPALGLLMMLLLSALCRIFAKDGLGMGDVKLFMALGLYQGLTLALRTLFIISVVSIPAALILTRAKGKTSHDRVAFGPYIAAGAVLSQLMTLLSL